MSDATEYGRESFGQGGLNDQLDVDSLVGEIGLDSSEIAWRKDFVDFTEEDVRRLETYQGLFAAHAPQVADEFYENLTAYEEIASMVDDVVSQANRVAEEIDELAAANEQQAAMVTEVEETVTQLSSGRSATDGGTIASGSGGATTPDDVSIPEDLPDDMPEFVVEMLSEDQLRQVATGELDRSDLL